MPRKLPSSFSVQAVHDFLKIFLAPSDSDDDILPKNGAYSPFYGFSRIYPQHTSLQDGGTSLDGISRAGVNKVVGRLYQEGMRKPSRNGNPGDLNIPDAHKLARHFLKLRWRNPDVAADLSVLQQAWNEMQPQQVVESVRILRFLCQWKPGPAGRGGDRGSRRARDSDMDCARRKLEDGSVQRIAKAWADPEDDADDLSDRSTVVGSERSPRANTNRPDVLASLSSPSTGKRSCDWAAALGGNCARSPASAACVQSASAVARLSSQDLLMQLAKQVNTVASPSSSAAPLTSAQLLSSSNPPKMASAWGNGVNPLQSCSKSAVASHGCSSFASTLLSQAPTPTSAPPSASPSAPLAARPPTTAQVVAARAQPPMGAGSGLTLPPLSLSTSLPPLSAVLEKAFA